MCGEPCFLVKTASGKQHSLCTGTAGKASSHWDWKFSAASAFAVVTVSTQQCQLQCTEHSKRSGCHAVPLALQPEKQPVFLKPECTEVRFKENSKLAYKLIRNLLLLRYPISLIEFLPFTARTDECCKQDRFCWQPDSYVQAFMIKP